MRDLPHWLPTLRRGPVETKLAPAELLSMAQAIIEPGESREVP